MDKLVERYVGVNSKYDLTYKLVPDLKNNNNKPINGRCHWGNGRDVVIEINERQLSGRRALSIARTILHETLHAYIFAFTTASDPNPKEKEFQDTWELYKEMLVEGGDMHHDVMMRGLIDLLAQATEAAHKNNEYERFWEYNSEATLEDQANFYKWMALEGLPEVIIRDYIPTDSITKYSEAHEKYKNGLSYGWCNH